MWTRVESKEVMRRFITFANDYNQKCPTAKHMRNTINGSIEVVRKVDTIKESYTTTFQNILTDYLHHYNEVRQIIHPDQQTLDNLPRVATNAVKLAFFCRTSARTMRNHLPRLEELGVIQRQFRGSESDFWLWINPDFLYGKEVDLKKQKAAQDASLGVGRKNFPHNHTHRKNLKPETRRADLLIEHGKKVHGKKGNTEPLVDGSVTRREVQTGGAARRENFEISQPAPQAIPVSPTSWLDARIAEIESNKPKGPSGVKRQFVEMMLEFWLTASQTLYTNRTFTKEESERAIIAIMFGVYGNFRAKRSDLQWTQFQDETIQRLTKAARYFDKHPDKYPASPFSIHKENTGYFDADNQNGFIKTLAWLKADQGKASAKKKAAKSASVAKSNAEFLKAEQERVEREVMEGRLQTARYDFTRLKNDKAPRVAVAHILQSSSPEIALFNYWNSYFARFDRKWQELFIMQYQAGQSRKFKMPIQHKRRGKQSVKADSATIVEWENWMDEGGWFTQYV